VRKHCNAAASFDRRKNGRSEALDPRRIGHTAILDWDVKVAACEHTLSRYLALQRGQVVD
jgi:hypothetical protein